jgi:hypothetical protein
MTRRLINEKHPVDPTSGKAAGVVTHRRGAGAHHSNRLSEPSTLRHRHWKGRDALLLTLSNRRLR